MEFLNRLRQLADSRFGHELNALIRTWASHTVAHSVLMLGWTEAKLMSARMLVPIFVPCSHGLAGDLSVGINDEVS